MYQISRSCPKCGTFFFKALICPTCQMETIKGTNDTQEMSLQKCITETDCNSVDAHTNERPSAHESKATNRSAIPELQRVGGA